LVIVVVGLVGVVMVEVPGLPGTIVHDAPALAVAPMATDPPGSVIQLRPLSGPPFADDPTVTVTASLAVQPAASVAVSVYVVVDAGVTVGVSVVEPVILVVGDQV
jgi:hypothetical protein